MERATTMPEEAAGFLHPQRPSWLPAHPLPGPRLTSGQAQAAEAPHGRLLRRQTQCPKASSGAGKLKVA